MHFVSIIDTASHNAYDDSMIVPFQYGHNAIDFAVEVARAKLPATYKQAASEESDIYEILDRFNDLAEGRLMIKIIVGFNTRSFALRGKQDPSDLDNTTSIGFCPQDR